MTNHDAAGLHRVRLRITGVVQGVGFRPFLHRLAGDLGLAGHVGNDTDGVFCEVEGSTAAVEAFVVRLRVEAPPLARIEAVERVARPATGQRGFDIVASRPSAVGVTPVSADLGPCRACLAEMSDPSDRRHGYPLLNCTGCGPRFTITRAVPYDRSRTTMAGFEMCAECRAEYDDPFDRRFHAQPTACPACGPTVWLEQPLGVRTDTTDPVATARDLAAAGAILAVKGVGGYHLACRADDDRAVGQLRRRKQRPDKPLAVMVADLDTARSVALVDDAEAALLEGPERPIVLVRRRGDPGVVPRLATGIAPGNHFLGVILPSSPLHVQLVAPGEVWVMTSGNLAGLPVCTDDDEARTQLREVADACLAHDRPIHVPCDDSVVRVLPAGAGRSAALMPVRRSRGYAPYPVALRLPPGPSVLAVGGELKATLCLRRDDRAFMGAHIGDVQNLETLEALDRSAAHLQALFRTAAEVLACDAHPGYASHRWAHDRADGRPVVRVQHHHAHLAALMAEHRVDGPLIGFAFDGTGYGTDGTIWGGEVLLADLRTAERIGHLAPSSLPGGDAAIRQPRRQALARLHEAGVTWTDDLPCVVATPAAERRILQRQLVGQLGTVPTSSMGRLFDAVASLCGVRQRVTYEGQAPIELEGLLHGLDLTSGAADEDGRYAFDLDEAGVWHVDGLIRAVVRDVRRQQPAHAVAARFHAAVAAAVLEAAERARDAHGIDVVGLSGGVFGNVALTTAASDELTARGFNVLRHHLVPCNDGGLALGQAAVAAATLAP